MSDQDEYLSDESYEFEFEEDEEEDAQIYSAEENSSENKYYYAKGLREDSLEDAALQFRLLVASVSDGVEREWIFKAYKQLAKIHYKQHEYSLVLKDIAEMMKLLPYLNGNYAEESVNKTLNKYATSADHVFVDNLYDVIVTHLQDLTTLGTSGNRIWLKININRLNQLLEIDELKTCGELLSAIKERIRKVSESTKTSYALEIIAAEIVYTMKTTRDISLLSELYRQSLHINSTITHSQVMGVIRECGATVQFFRQNYDKARFEFYECFKNYDEAGSSSKRKVLKYLIICCLLVESEVNPFESQETQSYAQLAEFMSLIKLVDAYEKIDLARFQSVVSAMKHESDPLILDPLFNRSIAILTHNLKLKTIYKFAISYGVVQFDYLIEKLGLTEEDKLEDLLIELANKGTIGGLEINFTARCINFAAKHKEPLSPAVEGKSVQKNMRSLLRLSYGGPWCLHTQDYLEQTNLTNHEQAILSNAFLEEDGTLLDAASSADIAEKSLGDLLPDGDTALEQLEFFHYMQSSIPRRLEQRSSQKEIVFLEQRGVSENATKQSPENDEAAANTEKGILESAMGSLLGAGKPSEAKHEEERLCLLHEWTHRLYSDTYHS